MSDQSKQNVSRRDFVRQSAQLAGAAIIGAEMLAPAEAAPAVRTASDWVALGRKTRVKIPRLGMGTGSINGKVQRDLGQEGFNKLIAYAYERGVRYIDTADNYKTHEMIREAIKANKIPRDKIFIQTKLPIRQETTNQGPVYRHGASLREELDVSRVAIAVHLSDELDLARLREQTGGLVDDVECDPPAIQLA